jgi:hypothetical protein
MSMIGRFMPSTKTVYYSCVEDASEQRFAISTIYGDPEEIIEDAAKDYHDAHDGARDTWPRTFVLFDSEDGPEIARCHVEREFEPVFTVVEIVKAPQ